MDYEKEVGNYITYLSRYYYVPKDVIIESLNCSKYYPYDNLTTLTKYKILNVLVSHYGYDKRKLKSKKLNQVTFGESKTEKYKITSSKFSRKLKDKTVSCECIGKSKNLTFLGVDDKLIKLREPLRVYTFLHKFYKSYFISGNQKDIKDYVYPWFMYWYKYEYTDEQGFVHQYSMKKPYIVSLSCPSKCKNEKSFGTSNIPFDAVQFDDLSYNRVLDTFNIYIFHE